MTTTIQETNFAEALDKMSYALYNEDEWTKHRNKFESVGIDIAYYDMQCEVFDRLYEEQPTLFTNYQWINDETGMPLWVRPGVDWIPQHELEDEYD